MKTITMTYAEVRLLAVVLKGAIDLRRRGSTKKMEKTYRNEPTVLEGIKRNREELPVLKAILERL